MALYVTWSVTWCYLDVAWRYLDIYPPLGVEVISEFQEFKVFKE